MHTSNTQVTTTDAYVLTLPDAAVELPFLIDSPHSGAVFPADFESLATDEELATAWDAWVAELWRGVVTVGGTLLEARFPRVVIDPNRACDDIDPDLLASPWPVDAAPIMPSVYSDRGMGLIRRFILPGKPLYAAPLTVRQVRQRIDSLYMPYHKTLEARLDALHARFGQVWHIDCHSMKSRGNAMNIDSGAQRADVVLGDLDGTSCAPEFMDLVASELQRRGYSVARNNPYKGGYIVRRYGKPAEGRHTLQVELNRALYMDEGEIAKTDGFARVQSDLRELCGLIAESIRGNIS